MLVISPWTVGGYVCSEVFDHTSVIRFLERWTGVREPNIGAWRRQATGDLTGAFDFRHTARRPGIDQPGAIPAFTGRWKPQPPAEQSMPEQEPGTRPARPLPYQPDAYARVADGELTLRLANTGRRAVHFALYPYAAEYSIPQHFDVVREQEVTVPLSGGTYDFVVTGPNGFRREFQGPVNFAADVTTSVDADRRVLRVTLRNTGTATRTFTVGGRTVDVRAGRTATVAHGTGGKEHGWYDLEITCGEFRRRLAGHIENGRASVSG